MVTQTGVKWGTDSKVRMFDPASGLSIELGACGEFNLQVVNSRKLLVKLVGTTNVLKGSDVLNNNAYGVKTMTGKFKALIVSKVKSVLAKVIRESNVNVLEVDSYLEEISDRLRKEINQVLDDYGLYIPEFFVTSIMTPDDDPNFRRMKEQYAEQYLLVRDEQIKKNIALAEQQRRIVEAQTGAQEEIIAAQAKAEAYRLKAEAEAREMQMKGYTYQQETQRQVGLAAMENIGVSGGVGANNGSNISSIVSDMMNIGVGLSVAGQVASTIKDTVTPIVQTTSQITQPPMSEFKPVENKGWSCPNCGNQNITSKFCPECGMKKPEALCWTCPSCGLSKITTKFCPECGTKMEG